MIYEPRLIARFLRGSITQQGGLGTVRRVLEDYEGPVARTRGIAQHLCAAAATFEIMTYAKDSPLTTTVYKTKTESGAVVRELSEVGTPAVPSKSMVSMGWKSVATSACRTPTDGVALV